MTTHSSPRLNTWVGSIAEQTGFRDGFRGLMSDGKQSFPRDQWVNYSCGYIEGARYAELYPEYKLPPIIPV